MRSSTSTVNGRKSTSRKLPATAVARSIVSPWRTTTAPDACLAILPVSNEISLPAISTETRVTASLLLIFFSTFLCSARRVGTRVPGGSFSLSLIPNQRSLADVSPPGRFAHRAVPAPEAGSPAAVSDRARGRRETLAQQLHTRQLCRRGRLIAPAHDPVGARDHQRALGKPALVQDSERGACRALGLEIG